MACSSAGGGVYGRAQPGKQGSCAAFAALNQGQIAHGGGLCTITEPGRKRCCPHVRCCFTEGAGRLTQPCLGHQGRAACRYFCTPCVLCVLECPRYCMQPPAQLVACAGVAAGRQKAGTAGAAVWGTLRTVLAEDTRRERPLCDLDPHARSHAWQGGVRMHAVRGGFSAVPRCTWACSHQKPKDICHDTGGRSPQLTDAGWWQGCCQYLSSVHSRAHHAAASW